MPRVAKLQGLIRNYVYGRALAQAYEAAKLEFRWNCVFFYGQSYQLQRRTVRLCKSDRVATVADLTEWFPSNLKSVLSPNHWDQVLFRRHFVFKHDGVVCISKEWQSFIHSNGPATALIPAMSKLTKETRNKKSLEKTHTQKQVFTIGYLGSMSKRDLPWMMIDVLQTCRQRGHPVQLMVLGDVKSQKPGRDILKHVKDNPFLRDSVIFSGWLERHELLKKMQSVDAFLLLREENKFSRSCFATRLPELLETGRPLIATDVGDIGIYLSNWKDVILIPASNQETHIANSIEKLIGNPKTAMRLGKEGYRSAIQQFGYEKHSKTLLQLISQALSSL